MYATKEYYESKIAYLQERSSKLDEIKSFIDDIRDLKNLFKGITSLSSLARFLFTGATGAITIPLIAAALGIKITSGFMERYENKALKAAEEGEFNWALDSLYAQRLSTIRRKELKHMREFINQFFRGEIT